MPESLRPAWAAVAFHAKRHAADQLAALSPCAKSKLLEAAQGYGIETQEVTDLGGNQVLGVLELAMTGKATDIDVKAVIFTVVTVRDGLITRMDEYLERAEALEAAGLSE